ncbi:type VI secretion system baseplate subunit TssG [Reyranella sp.]|uniref:type VI secretion system baseplate subunit TssG n=1 Tax=Reyranella sp. TaxID=1929291 RepID=UPI003D1220CD
MGRLQEQPQRFTFDAAVRVLTFLRRRADPAAVARFTSASGSSYLPAEVTRVQTEAGIAEPLVAVGVVGLTGPTGVLPRYYTDAVVADQRSRAFSLTRFLDLISHRMVAAFAAAGAKYRPHRAADVGALAAGPERTDPVAESLLSLTGYGTPHLADRLLAGPAALRHYAGFFSVHPRSTDRLEALASDWLGQPVKVDQFAGAWLALPVEQRTRLGVGLSPGGFCQLSVDAAVGVRAWDQQARITLRIGPLDLAYFERLLPDQPLLRELIALVRAYVGFEVGFAVNPVLARDAVPALALTLPTEPKSGNGRPLLGWNTWLPTSQATQRKSDAGDALFDSEIVEGRT